jgi:hypothetical protein
MFFPILQVLEPFFLSLQLFQDFFPLLNQLDGANLPAVPHEDESVGHGDEGEEHAEAEVEHETIFGLCDGAQRVADVEPEREEPVEEGEPPGSGFRVGNVGDVRVGSEEETSAATSAICLSIENMSYFNSNHMRMCILCLKYRQASFYAGFFYLRIRVYAIENDPFYRTYPLFYGHSWSFYMQIRYMLDIFYGPYLAHITRSTCITNLLSQKESSNYILVL